MKLIHYHNTKPINPISLSLAEYEGRTGMSMQGASVGANTATASRRHATFNNIKSWSQSSTLHRIEVVCIVIAGYVSTFFNNIFYHRKVKILNGKHVAKSN